MRYLAPIASPTGRLAARLLLAAVAVGFVAAFAATHYELVRTSVRILCLNCIGLGD